MIMIQVKKRVSDLLLTLQEDFLRILSNFSGINVPFSNSDIFVGVSYDRLTSQNAVASASIKRIAETVVTTFGLLRF